MTEFMIQDTTLGYQYPYSRRTCLQESRRFFTLIGHVQSYDKDNVGKIRNSISRSMLHNIIREYKVGIEEEKRKILEKRKASEAEGKGGNAEVSQIF